MSLIIKRRDPVPVSRRDISTYPWTNGATVPTNLQSPVGGYSYQTADAFRIAAVVACLGMRSGAFAQIPLKAYEESADGASSLLRPQPSLFVEPQRGGIASIHKIQMSISRDVWGYAAGIITDLDAAGYMNHVEWVSPDVIKAKTLADGTLEWRINGELFDASRIFHVPSRWVLPGRPLGMSPLEKSGLTDLAILAQNFGRNWFREGAIPSSILYSDDMLTEEQSDDLVAKMKSRWSRRGPAVIGAGLKYQPISVNANESQFLDTMIRVASDIAISFNLPPSKIAASMSSSDVKYQNLEQSTQQYLMDSINPDLVVVQESWTRVMRPGTFARWETGAFLRSDLKTRYESYEIGIRAGFLDEEDVRAIEDLPPRSKDNGVIDTKGLADAISKMTGGVDIILTAEEARTLLNTAGANLVGPPPTPTAVTVAPPAPPTMLTEGVAL
jgi:HK97 family phage portal protein